MPTEAHTDEDGTEYYVTSSDEYEQVNDMMAFALSNATEAAVYGTQFNAGFSEVSTLNMDEDDQLLSLVDKMESNLQSAIDDLEVLREHYEEYQQNAENYPRDITPRGEDSEQLD